MTFKFETKKKKCFLTLAFFITFWCLWWKLPTSEWVVSPIFFFLSVSQMIFEKLNILSAVNSALGNEEALCWIVKNLFTELSCLWMRAVGRMCFIHFNYCRNNRFQVHAMQVQRIIDTVRQTNLILINVLHNIVVNQLMQKISAPLTGVLWTPRGKLRLDH